MDNKDIKAVLKTALSLFLICAAATTLLALINSVTSPMIEENNSKAADDARLQVLPLAASFESAETKNGEIYYIGTSGKNVKGYVFITTAKGYGGQIEVMTGIDKDGTVTGISILTINETPGLGMNAKKESFTSGFKGSKGPFTVKKGMTSSDGEISAVTSATITSEAVTKAVNNALAIYEQVKEG